MRNKRILIPILIGLIIIAVGLWIWVSTVKEKEPEVYKIGANLILTGPIAMSGEYVRNGIDLAVEEINKKGGVKGGMIEIIYGDSKNDPKEAIAVFHKMAYIDKVPAIISMFSSPSLAQVKLADENKVVLATTIVSAPGVGDMSPWVFRYFPSVDSESSVLADFIAKKQNIKEVAVLYINDDYGLSGFTTFKKLYEDFGGRISFSESFEKGGFDFRNILFRLKEIKPKAVFIIGYDKPLGIIIKQIQEVGIKATIFTPSSLSVPVVLDQAGGTAEGAYLTMSLFSLEYPTPIAREFIARYEVKYGKSPSHYSAFGYDLIKLIAEAINRKGYSAEAIRDGLLSIKDFPAIMGNVSFLPNGESEFPITIRKIKNGKVMPFE